MKVETVFGGSRSKFHRHHVVAVDHEWRSQVDSVDLELVLSFVRHAELITIAGYENVLIGESNSLVHVQRNLIGRLDRCKFDGDLTSITERFRRVKLGLARVRVMIDL